MLSDYIHYLSGWIPLGIQLLLLVGGAFTAIWVVVWFGTGFWSRRQFWRIFIRTWFVFVIIYLIAWITNPPPPIPTRVVLLSETQTESQNGDIWFQNGLVDQIKRGIILAEAQITVLDTETCPVLQRINKETSRHILSKLKTKWVIELNDNDGNINLSIFKSSRYPDNPVLSRTIRASSFHIQSKQIAGEIVSTITGKSNLASIGHPKTVVPDSIYRLLYDLPEITAQTDTAIKLDHLSSIIKNYESWYLPKLQRARWLADYQPGLFYKEIRELLSDASRNLPGGIEALIELADINLKYRDWDSAEGALKIALSNDQYEPRIFYYMSRLKKSRFEDIHWKSKTELLNYALYLAPGYEDAYLKLSDFQMKQLEKYAALKTAEQGLEVDSKSIPLLLTKSAALVELSKHMETAEVCRQVLLLDSLNASAYYNLGIAQLWMKEYERAISHFEKSYKLGGTVDNLYYIGMAYQRLDEWEKAVTWFERRFANPKGTDDKIAVSARNLANKLKHWIAQREKSD